MLNKKYVLGIDLGGTNAKFGLVNRLGKVREFIERPTPKSLTAAKALLKEIIRPRLKLIRQIGLGIAGAVDQQKYLVISPNLNFSGWQLKRFLEKEFKLPVKIENDANCFTLGEAVYGAGKKYNIVLGITLGTGVGGGIVINKKLYRGRSLAGEFGHQILDFQHLISLEDLQGAKKLGLTAKQYQALAQEAKTGKTTGRRFWRWQGQVLGCACLNLTYLFDPDIIILGGKITRYYPLLAPTLNLTMKKNIFGRQPKIAVSKFKDQAGVIGASRLFSK